MAHNLFHNLNLFKLILYAGAIHPMSPHIPTIGAVLGSPRKYLIALLNTLMCSIYVLSFHTADEYSKIGLTQQLYSFV